MTKRTTPDPITPPDPDGADTQLSVDLGTDQPGQEDFRPEGPPADLVEAGNLPAELAPGITEDRADGRVAVYDTRYQRFVTGPLDPDDDEAKPMPPDDDGRYQLLRV